MFGSAKLTIRLKHRCSAGSERVAMFRATGNIRCEFGERRFSCRVWAKPVRSLELVPSLVDWLVTRPIICSCNQGEARWSLRGSAYPFQIHTILIVEDCRGFCPSQKTKKLPDDMLWPNLAEGTLPCFICISLILFSYVFILSLCRLGCNDLYGTSDFNPEHFSDGGRATLRACEGNSKKRALLEPSAEKVLRNWLLTVWTQSTVPNLAYSSKHKASAH